jgi:anthranilate synthase component 2
MTLLVDNYDSFTYNLYHLLATVGEDKEVKVARNDALTVADIEALAPDRIVLSPGPGRPADAGVCEALVNALAGRVPILGVCLGHQAICEAFGAAITHAPRLVHGKATPVTLSPDCTLFAGLPATIKAGRYHSLAVDEATLPASLAVIARDADGTVMGVEAPGKALWGLQFHPESVLTPDGGVIARNFLRARCSNGGEV